MGSDGTSGADRPEGKHMHAVDPATLQVIGKPWRKVDARSRVTGQTRFADDLKLPRMLFCKLLRSTVAHARIVSVDTSAAEALPGVHAVLRGEELPNTFGILPVSQDEHTLCYDKVRFIGDPVVAIAAVDEDTAWDACRLVKVEYEKLDVVTDVFEAAKQRDPER